MTIEQYEVVVVWAVVASYALTAGGKIAVVVAMLRNRTKVPLDRAIIANQLVLAADKLLLAAIFAVIQARPLVYASHRWGWLTGLLLVALLIAWTVVWLLLALWAERVWSRRGAPADGSG